MRLGAIALIGIWALPLEVAAEDGALVAARMLRSATILTADDLVQRDEVIPGALTDPKQAIGMETRNAIYAGRPIRQQDIGVPAIVERNDVIALNYHYAGLSIVTEGRAMERAGVGDVIRVMNLSSRTTIIGVVMSDGSVNVAPMGSGS